MRRVGRALVARTRHGISSTAEPAEETPAESQSHDVEARLDRLEREVQEVRALGFRVAELADLVTELLALASSRDDPAFREAVERYRREV